MFSELSKETHPRRRPWALYLVTAIGVCLAWAPDHQARAMVPVSLEMTWGSLTNGIIRSGPLTHAIVQTSSGTTLNIVSSRLDDGGPIDDSWDFNFFRAPGGNNIGNLYLFQISTGRFAVDGSGQAKVFQVGDVISSSTPFSTGGTLSSLEMSAHWLAGANGYLGVEFNCDGRLANPVAPPGVCYGYVHLTTTAPNGFPARIMDTAFDGDGRPITVEGIPPSPDPDANVTPVSLDATIAVGTTGSDTLVIGNIGGSDLTYSIVESETFDLNPTMETRTGDSLSPPMGCDNPNDIPWLSTSASSGTVAPGESSNVVAAVDAAALGEGHYSANLCVTTNDPLQPLIVVPFRLTVVAAEAIFCSGFEVGEDRSCGLPPHAGDVVYSGPVNVSIPQTGDGLFINYLTGQASSTEVPGFDFNPYLGGGRLLFYWGSSSFNFGVAATSSGPYLVLGPGDTIGPSSTFSSYANGENDETRLFLAGVTGYLGVMFTSEETGQVLYGYVHMQTTAGNGFPATIFDYAYDKTGAAITIP